MRRIDLRIREGFDPADLAARYQADGVVQMCDFLIPAVADALGSRMAELPFFIVASDESGEPRILSDGATATGVEQARAFLQDTVRRAAAGFAFVHQACPLPKEHARNRELPTAGLAAFLHSRAFLDIGSRVTGQGVDRVRVQAASYRRGDFVNLQDGADPGEDRVAGFVLGLTRGWRPDWGGQLLFHDTRGDIERGLSPQFNVLTIFRVPSGHSVASVAPYAAHPSMSLSGWFIRGSA